MKFGKLSRGFEGWPIVDYKGLKRHLRHAKLNAHMSAEFEHELVTMVSEVETTFVAIHASLVASLDALEQTSTSARGSPIPAKAGTSRAWADHGLPSPQRLTSAERPRSRLELVHSAYLLRSYALLQYVSVLKIVKKHDKLLGAGARAATPSSSSYPPDGSPRHDARPHVEDADADGGACAHGGDAPAPLRARAVQLLAASHFVRALRFDQLFAALARAAADAGTAGDTPLRVASASRGRAAAARSRLSSDASTERALDDVVRTPIPGKGTLPIEVERASGGLRPRALASSLGSHARTDAARSFLGSDSDETAAANLDGATADDGEVADAVLEASVSEELAALLDEGFLKYEPAAIFAEAHFAARGAGARMGVFGTDRPRSNSGTMSVPLPSPLSRQGRYTRSQASARRLEAFDNDELGCGGLLSDAEGEAACGAFGRLELELDDHGAGGDEPPASFWAPGVAVENGLSCSCR